MKIGELAKRSGLSAYTIRYYERIGLLPYADRDRSSRRDYDSDILVWIEFLGRLKTTGMPIRDMLRYAALRKQGDTTGPERQAMLQVHRDQVRDRVAELQQCLLVLDQKIAGYAGEDQRMTDDDAVKRNRTRNPAGTRQTRARGD